MRLQIVEGSMYKEMTESVIAQQGQCPCVVPAARTVNTICICVEFRKQQTDGHCHCGRYQKVWKDD